MPKANDEKIRASEGFLAWPCGLSGIGLLHFAENK